jgi:hypothetical protein
LRLTTYGRIAGLFIVATLLSGPGEAFAQVPTTSPSMSPLPAKSTVNTDMVLLSLSAVPGYAGLQAQNQPKPQPISTTLRLRSSGTRACHI